MRTRLTVTGRSNLQPITEDPPPGSNNPIGGTAFTLGNPPASLRFRSQNRDHSCGVLTGIGQRQPWLTPGGLVTTVRRRDQATQRCPTLPALRQEKHPRSMLITPSTTSHRATTPLRSRSIMLGQHFFDGQLDTEHCSKVQFLAGLHPLHCPIEPIPIGQRDQVMA
jgi:hypothetical protein